MNGKISRWMLACAALLAVGAQAFAQDAWTTYMKPGEAHGFLGQFEGEWDEEVRLWMSPNAEPQVFTLHCTIKMVLGGRFMELRHLGEMAGMPYEGFAYLAFNNASERFTFASFNNMGTGAVVLEGNWMGAKRDIELRGHMVNPVDKDTMNVRQVVSFIDINTVLIENFDKAKGQDEYKTVEYLLRRRRG